MIPSEALQLRSTVKADGAVEVAVVRVPVPQPKADEVVVRIEASPINPSDVGMVFAGADLTRARAGGTAELPTISAPLAVSTPIGNGSPEKSLLRKLSVISVQPPSGAISDAISDAISPRSPPRLTMAARARWPGGHRSPVGGP